MKNNRRRVLAMKYSAFALLFLLLYILQSTPHLLEIGGIKPMLLIPAAVALSMYEGEFTGGLFGVLAGMFCDLGAFSFYGLYSVLLLACCVCSGLLVIYLMRRTHFVALMLSSASVLLCMLLRFYFDYGIWGYEGLRRLFLIQTVPSIVYTILTTPLFFWLFGRLEELFASRINV